MRTVATPVTSRAAPGGLRSASAPPSPPSPLPPSSEAAATGSNAPAGLRSSPWAVGVVTATAAVLVHLAADTWLGVDQIWFFAFLATLVAAWFGGMPAGSLVTVVCALWALWATAASSPGANPQWLVQLAVYVPFGLLISAVCQSRHQAIARMRRQASTWTADGQRLGTALMHAGVNVFELDEQLRCTSMKQPFLGTAPADALGQTHENWLPRNDALTIQTALKLVLDAGKPLHREFRLSGPGKRAVLDYFMLPLTDSARRTTGVAVVAVDMTERHAAPSHTPTDDAQADGVSPQWLAEQSDDFLANLSHELRTPLNALSGWSHILSRHELDDALRLRAAEAIARSVQAQKALIDDFLDLGRLASGRLTVNLQPCELSDILQRAIASVQSAAKARWIEILSNCTTPCAELYADPARLEQVFHNLLSNAVKFSPMGAVVEVRVAATTDQIRIEVIDSGQGISSADLPHVFDRFKQTTGVTTRRHGGMGMGLAMAKALIELHQGSIKLKSQGLGSGTTVRLILPVRPRELDTTEAAHFAPPSTQHGDLMTTESLAWSRILIVDNDEDSLEVAAIALRDRGALVRAFDDPHDARMAASNGSFDLIISDIGMPLMDGFELLRQLRSSGVTVPAIALTAFTGDDIRQRAQEAGYMTVLVKPLAPPRLVEAVATALATANAQN